MRIHIDKLFEEFANQNLRNVDWHKHVLPKTENDAIDDFVNQDYDIGKTDRPLYPMFPYMTEVEYEKAADDLRTSNADGFINYNVRINNKTGMKNARPRAVKYRKINLPATPHDKEFYEMVVYSLSDDTVIGYYLCRKGRIDREKRTSVYDLKGNPTSDNAELRKQLRGDSRAWREVCDFIDRQDESLEEAYSQIKPLKNRNHAVIGYIKTDPARGDKLITDRFGQIRGYYKASADYTLDRNGQFVGRGDLLTMLLGNLNEGYESDLVEENLRECIISTLNYLAENNYHFPSKKYLADSWEDWAEEYDYSSKNAGELLEDALCLIDYIDIYGFYNHNDGDIEDIGDLKYYLRKLEKWHDIVASNNGEPIAENSNRYRNLNKGLFGDKSGKIKTWAIISPQNPLGWKDSDEPEFKEKFLQWTTNKSKYNADAVKRIKSTKLLHYIENAGDKALKYSGAKYVPIFGSYGDKERSYMIFNISLSDAKVIAREYGQESFFFANVSKEGTKIAYYVTNDGCKTYRLEGISNVVTEEEDAEDFFSKFGRKFRINMKAFGDDIPDIANNGEFEESFNEDRTFMSRALHRRNAYKK